MNRFSTALLFALTPARIRVFNMLGQVVYDSPILGQDFISTHNWHRGAYIVKIGNVNKKIVVE